MDIFEFAMEKEKYAEQFYRDLAERAPDAGLKEIFTMLADEEEKHCEVVENMKAQADVESAQTSVLGDARDIFEKMREGSKKFNLDVSQIELYKKAQDIEKQARNFYLEKVGEVKLQNQKNIFLQLAEEEKKHYFLLDNIIEFVNRPNEWLENAEFYHLEEY
ncbi:MAG: ferritin family protein [Phycisphaerales bacterium]|jgi:rubrerythrin